MNTPREIAEAFSRHRFREVYASLSDDIVWTSRGGGPPIHSRSAVVDACEASLSDLASTAVDFRRVVVAADDRAAAVDVVARYVDGDEVSVVSSCDVYEFQDGAVVAITTYAVELDDQES
jgi:ketosteroid isomerase-like protein